MDVFIFDYTKDRILLITIDDKELEETYCNDIETYLAWCWDLYPGQYVYMVKKGPIVDLTGKFWGSSKTFYEGASLSDKIHNAIPIKSIENSSPENIVPINTN